MIRFLRTEIPYADLFADRAWRRWTLVTALSRLPLALAPLGLVLAGRYATGSFAGGGVLAGTYTFAEALTAPSLGRRIDRLERRRALAVALAWGVVALAALSAAVIEQAGLPLLLVAAILAAAAPSGVQGGLRAYLPELVGEARASRAFALDASVLEIEWLSAPALVALVALLGAPYLAIVLMFVGTAAALIATRLLPPLTIRSNSIDLRSVWRNAEAMRSYVASAVLGFTEGMVTVALAPLLVALHSRAGFAGLLLVALSITSAVGGFAFGAAQDRIPGTHEQQANAVMIGLGLLAIPVALAPSVLIVAFAVAAFGLLVAPLNGLRTQLLSEAVPAPQRAEGFSIVYAAFGLGFGLSGLTMAALLGPLGIRPAIDLAAGVAIVTGLGYSAAAMQHH